MKKAKKDLFSIACSLALLLYPQISQARPASLSGTGLSLKLVGGAGYFYGGDLNSGLKGLLDSAKYRVGGSIEGDYRPLHWGPNLEGEFMVNLSPNLGVSFGLGYLQAKQQVPIKGVILGTPPFVHYEGLIRQKVVAIPVKLGFCVALPLGHSFKLYANAGIGCYFGSVYWEKTEDSTNTDNHWHENWKGSKISPGYHGGLGFELSISKRVALVLEGVGRHVLLKGPKGDFSSVHDTNGDRYENTTNDTTLWYYEEYVSMIMKYYPRTVFDSEKPRSFEYRRNIREGIVDLSGVSINLGIRIRIF